MIIWPFQTKTLKQDFYGSLIVFPFSELNTNGYRIIASPLRLWGKIINLATHPPHGSWNKGKGCDLCDSIEMGIGITPNFKSGGITISLNTNKQFANCFLDKISDVEKVEVRIEYRGEERKLSLLKLLNFVWNSTTSSHQ